MDINDEEFKNMVRHNYENADIYELWNSYVIAEKHGREYKKLRWIGDAKDSELEMIVLVELMRKLPKEVKNRFYDNMNHEYKDAKVNETNFISFCETLDFFKTEILEKNE
jgi:hypothetical protein